MKMTPEQGSPIHSGLRLARCDLPERMATLGTALSIPLPQPAVTNVYGQYS
jgi:hypothetical protein